MIAYEDKEIRTLAEEVIKVNLDKLRNTEELHPGEIDTRVKAASRAILTALEVIRG